MPRATCELDALLASSFASRSAIRAIEEDDEWCRTLSAEPRTSTKPSEVFADIHDVLVSSQYPLAADPSETMGTLDAARAAARDWACRALSGNAEITLDGADCYMLFQLINQAGDVLLNAFHHRMLAAEQAMRTIEAVARFEIEPALAAGGH